MSKNSSNKPRKCCWCGKPHSAVYAHPSRRNRATLCAECAENKSLWAANVEWVLLPKEVARVKAYEADGAPGDGVPWKPGRDWRTRGES